MNSDRYALIGLLGILAGAKVWDFFMLQKIKNVFPHLRDSGPTSVTEFVAAMSATQEFMGMHMSAQATSTEEVEENDGKDGMYL